MDPARKDPDQSDFLGRFLPVQPMLRGYLLTLTRNHAEADDLLQEVAAVLWRKFEEFDASRDFTAWAMGMARIQALRWRRSVARSRVILSEETIARLAETACAEAEESAGTERRPSLATCLDKLPPLHREIVQLRFTHDQPLAAIGASLGKSEQAVQMLMVRIRRWLKECIEKTLATEAAGASP